MLRIDPPHPLLGPNPHSLDILGLIEAGIVVVSAEVADSLPQHEIVAAIRSFLKGSWSVRAVAEYAQHYGESDLLACFGTSVRIHFVTTPTGRTRGSFWGRIE